MVPQLTIEKRRHWRISLALMLGGLVSGIAVSNERGVFVPLHDLANTFAVTARAFAALASPPGGMRLEPYENLLLSESPDKPAPPPQTYENLILAEGTPMPPQDETPQAMVARMLDTPPDFPPALVPPVGPIMFAPPPRPPVGTPFFSAPSVAAPSVAATQHGAVPEPASWAMLITGFAAIGLIQRRMARKARAKTA